MTGTVGLGRFSTGSPSSSTFEQNPGGAPGKCHAGTMLFTNGSLKASETSWLIAATSAKMVGSPKRALETLASNEVAKARVCTKTVLPTCWVSNAVWKPPMQQSKGKPKKKSP